MGDIKKNRSSSFKSRVALEAIKEEKTVSEISNLYGVHPTQIRRWKGKVLEGIDNVFSEKKEKEEINQKELIDSLYQEIGQLKMELTWLKKKVGLLE